MDDHRARKMLDALADLFLTGVQPVASPPRPAQGVQGASIPTLPSAAHDQDGEQRRTAAPATATSPVQLKPIRLPPKLAGTRVAPPPASSRGSAGATAVEVEPPPPLKFADHLPSTGEQPSRPRQRVAAPPRLEAVMLGNLPGFGGPWLNQYAFDLAQSLGPVVVLHLDSEQIDVDIVSAMDQRRDLRQMCAALRREPAGDLLNLLHTLAEPGDLAIGAWLVHLALPLDAAAVQVARDMERWTILCGADDAAAVSAYRTFKQLLDGDLHAARRKPGIMVMGAEDSRARAAGDKLHLAGKNFLNLPIELLGMRQRMVPVNVESLGSFPQRPQLWPQVAQILKLAHEQGPTEDQAIPSAPAPFAQALAEADTPAVATALPRLGDEPALPDTASAPQAEAPTPAMAEPLFGDRDDQELHDEAAPAAATQDDVTEASAVIEPVEPAPEQADTAARPAADDEPDLLSLIAQQGLDGGTALAAVCPRHPRTQIALDAHGRLHLLRRHQQQREDLRVALSDLLDAQAWVVEHLQLLQLTHRQGRMDAGAPPMLHLFTDQAKAAVKLCAGAGQHVKLRLLQAVTVRDETAWICVELN